MTEAIHLASEDLRGSLRKDEDMRRHTSWRAGGHVERMYQPADLADLVLYLRNLPVDEPLLAVGLGSNLLVRDGGLRGTVLLLHAALSELRLEQDGTIYAQAGVPGAKLARFAANNNLRGAEFFAGIPGTVGGMLAMNAGCYGGETWNVVERVQTVDRAGILHERMPTEYEIGYRHVLKKDEGDNVAQSPEFFVGAWFRLEKGAGELSRKEIKALLNKRISSQPLNLPNAGSVFRNTQGDHAARLIEMSGLKGMKIGGAQVSEKHANFIVNLGSATAADIESLINEVREIVQHKTGIALHPEVRIVGDAKVNSVGVDNGREMNNISPNTKRQEFGKVAVMFGGRSAEREVSLKSGAAVLAALQRSGVDAHAFDPATQGLHTLQEQGFQRVFIALHGRYGEDGTVQGALELMDIPYTGSGVMASALAMDKFRSKLVWQAMNLPVPDYTLLTQSSDWNAVVQQLGLPLFVKPANEGSSVGISKVKSVDDLPAAYAEAAKHDSIVIAEQFIGGGEYTAAILGKQALPVIKIVPASEFYDYDAKYSRNDTRYLCPCDLPAEKEAEMQQLAQQAFAAIGGAGWGRVDFLMDEAGKLYLLEINTSPGMTDHSLVPMAARVAGLSFEQLVVQILEHAHVG